MSHINQAPLILPVDGWQLKMYVGTDGELQIQIITDDSPSRTHYVRLGSIGTAAVCDYLARAFPARARNTTTKGE